MNDTSAFPDAYCMYVCMRMYVYVCICLYMYVCICICICMYVCRCMGAYYACVGKMFELEIFHLDVCACIGACWACADIDRSNIMSTQAEHKLLCMYVCIYIYIYIYIFLYVRVQ